MGLVGGDLPQSLKKGRLPKIWLEKEKFLERDHLFIYNAENSSQKTSLV